MIDTSKPVDRTGNAFCGPLVVAAILGTSTGTVAAEVAQLRNRIGGTVLHTGALRRTRGRSAATLRGTYDGELFAILTAHGYKYAPVDVGARYVRHRKCRGRDVFVNLAGTRFASQPPLFDSPANWAPWTYLQREALPLWRAALRLKDSGTYIVHLPKHWALIHDGKWCETYTQGEWRDLRNAPGRGRKVLSAWRVSK